MWCKSRIEAHAALTPARSRAPVALALVIAGMLSACSDIYYDRRETVALGADDHIASNMVAQMIDPWPRYVGNKNLAFDGNRMQLAADRYRRDCVIPPAPFVTTPLLGAQQQQVQSQAANCLPASTTQTPIQGTGYGGGQWSSQNSSNYGPSTASAK
jgi:hypothetical protein